MRKFFTLLFTIATIVVSAQILNPVSWEFFKDRISDSEVELTFKASIDDHWHMYSQNVEDEMIATKFTFIIGEDTSIVKPIESETIEQYEPLWEMTLRYFEN